MTRFRDKLLTVFLHSTEDDFIKAYSTRNLLTVSEQIRSWIHAAMREEGIKIAEPRLPKGIAKKKSKKLKNKKTLGR